MLRYGNSEFSMGGRWGVVPPPIGAAVPGGTPRTAPPQGGVQRAAGAPGPRRPAARRSRTGTAFHTPRAARQGPRARRDRPDRAAKQGPRARRD